MLRTDPILISILTEIFTTLASSTRAGVYESVVKQALPTLSTAIGASKLNESWVASTAIELVTSLETGAPESGLGEGFFVTLAPNLFACLRDAEDRDVLQVCAVYFRERIGKLKHMCRMESYASPGWCGKTVPSCSLGMTSKDVQVSTVSSQSLRSSLRTRTNPVGLSLVI